MRLRNLKKNYNLGGHYRNIRVVRDLTTAITTTSSSWRPSIQGWMVRRAVKKDRLKRQDANQLTMRLSGENAMV
jgi:hypothetical protein